MTPGGTHGAKWKQGDWQKRRMVPSGNARRKTVVHGTKQQRMTPGSKKHSGFSGELVVEETSSSFPKRPTQRWAE